MSHLRRVLFALAFLAAIAPLGLPAAAQNPNKPVTEHVDVTFPAPNLTRVCGFDVTAHVVGTFTTKLLPHGVEIGKIHYQHTFSGPGGSVTFNHVENFRATTTMSEDGTRVDTVSFTGTLLYHNVVPGYGSIGNNSGREVVQFTLEWDDELKEWVVVDEVVLFDAGPNDELGDEDYEVICGLLA